MLDESRISSLAGAFASIQGMPQVRETVEGLLGGLDRCDDPFVGAALPDEAVAGLLPEGIGSAWIFALRADVRTAPHCHPNSVQHMIVLSGGGVAVVGTERRTLQRFVRASPREGMVVIPENVAHAFEVSNEPLVVLSLHTASADDLIEIEQDSRASRTYR